LRILNGVNALDQLIRKQVGDVDTGRQNKAPGGQAGIRGKRRHM
jgi:hypothetical protein